MSKYALIMIDMQRGFIDPASPLCIPSAAATIPDCVRAISLCHESNIPVLYVTRHYRADGSDVEKCRHDTWLAGGRPMSEKCDAALSDAYPEEFKVRESDYCIYKPRFSAFFHTSVDLVLRRLGVDTVILAGTTTPNCVRTTCYDALSLDYDVIVLSDCTSSVTDEVQRANLSDMQRIGAEIADVDTLAAKIK
jgi:nicotinamidase-related amidase